MNTDIDIVYCIALCNLVGNLLVWFIKIYEIYIDVVVYLPVLIKVGCICGS